MYYGTVTICVESESEDELQAMQERIIEAINALELPVSISEDAWDETT